MTHFPFALTFDSSALTQYLLIDMTHISPI
jgi:hypothetical protein